MKYFIFKNADSTEWGCVDELTHRNWLSERFDAYRRDTNGKLMRVVERFDATCYSAAMRHYKQFKKKF